MSFVVVGLAAADDRAEVPVGVGCSKAGGLVSSGSTVSIAPNLPWRIFGESSVSAV